MITLTARILPITDDTTLDECAQAAQAAGMHLISNGRKVVVSPVIPPGYWKIAVKVKCPQRATLEPQACAA